MQPRKCLARCFIFIYLKDFNKNLLKSKKNGLVSNT